MKATGVVFAIVFALSSVAPSAFAAGAIENACIKSDRSASRSLCTCIQLVADVKLTGRDQKFAAKFFDDPHLAQVTRQSDNASKERFWLRYKEFGEVASKACS